MRCLALTLLLLSAGSVAVAEDEVEFSTELIHSDVPLWGVGDKEVWPRRFTDDDDSFGCAWQVKLGDWKIVQHDSDENWIRFSNYGVFHCYTIVSDTANDREELKSAQTKPSYFVNLGNYKSNGSQRELWAIQSGGRPGSEYMLLSRAIGPHPMTVFDLLQIVCPKRNVRKGPSLDILQTSYCAINTKLELIQLARSMAKIPPIGKMTFEEESPDS